MAKRFYSFSNMMLTSLIALLGFGSCKTTKKVESPKDPTIEEKNQKLEVDTLPQRPDRAIKLLYGVPATRKVERK
ncbi:MAG: hypothetical protein IJS48_07480 [Prevotella sp.]|jgi:hypothetical protein|nr:hypothetical protein [Prevotella sp.]